MTQIPVLESIPLRRRVRPGRSLCWCPQAPVCEYLGLSAAARCRTGTRRQLRVAAEAAWGVLGRGMWWSGHLGDVQVRVGQVELVHVDDLAARIGRGLAAHVVGRRAAGFHRGAGLPGCGGAAQAGRSVR